MTAGDTRSDDGALARRFHIADPDLALRYYDDLETRLREEWPEIQSFDGDGSSVPRPLVALTSLNALAGGLSFVLAKSPLDDELAVWVNAVLVLPGYRRQGLGSRLIAAARQAASRIGVARLFALTELPALYAGLEWSIVRSDNADFVMTVDTRNPLQRL